MLDYTHNWYHILPPIGKIVIYYNKLFIRTLRNSFCVKWNNYIFFTAEIGPSGMDRGYFGPWQTCKQAYHGGTKCGDSISRFHPVGKSRVVLFRILKDYCTRYAKVVRWIYAQ